jgi:hypothetical protein
MKPIDHGRSWVAAAGLVVAVTALVWLAGLSPALAANGLSATAPPTEHIAGTPGDMAFDNSPPRPIVDPETGLRVGKDNR